MATKLKIDPILIPDDVRNIIVSLKPEASYIVGGIVREIARNLMEGKVPSPALLTGKDWDIATACLPEEVIRRLKRKKFAVLPIGIEHGTVVVHGRLESGSIDPGRRYEVTTFRFDRECDGRHAVVEFADSLEEDLARRDFTVNALALDADTGEILDDQDALSDLQERIIRAVGDPMERFKEDYLRLIRAIRFALAIEGRIEEKTWAALCQNVEGIRNISQERIREELIKMLSYPRPSRGFLMMQECGLLKQIIPEFQNCFGVSQNRFHSDDIANHTLLVVDAISPKWPLLRFIALLHDLGKVRTRTFSEEKKDFVFFGHEVTGARLAVKVMKRLRFSGEEIRLGKLLTQVHMYPFNPVPLKKTVRRWLFRIGIENFRALIRLKIADRRGNRRSPNRLEPGMYETIRILRQIEKDQDALSLKDLEVNGRDLLAMGMKPGPAIGKILDTLLDAVLDNPSLNERETLLSLAKEMVSSESQESS